MKKIIFVMSIFSTLVGTANAAPITSPIYMPKEKDAQVVLSAGYSSSRFDQPSGKAFENYNITGDSRFGIRDKISLDYGLSFSFDKTVTGQSENSFNFNNFYIGGTGRVFDDNLSKIDIKLKFGTREVLLAEDSNNNNFYSDLSVMYGWEAEKYNFGLSAGLTQHNRDNWENESKTDLYLKFDNEFIISEKYTIGLDLAYTRVAKLAENGVTPVYDDYNQYSALIDFNYDISKNNFVGIYYKYARNDMRLTPYSMPSYDGRDLTENAFGVKYITEF